MSVLSSNQEIAWKCLVHSPDQLQSFGIQLFPAQKQRQGYLCVPGNLGIAVRDHLAQVLQSLLLIAAVADHRRRNLGRPAQASNDIEVDAQKVLSIHIIWV